MADRYSMVQIHSPKRERAPRSGTQYVDLTEELDSTTIASRVWFLSPGEAITYHRETAQEELYFAISGPGRMRIDDEYIEVPEGTVVRVPPETPRQVLNDTDDAEHVWLIVGAPKDRDEAKYLDR